MDDPDQRAARHLADGADQSDTQYPDYQTGQSYEAQQLRGANEEVVQVVYQRDQHGSLVGVESTSLLGSHSSQPVRSSEAPTAGQPLTYIDSSSPLGASNTQLDGPASSQIVIGAHQQLSRAASTLPPVAEESTSSAPNGVELDGTEAYILEDVIAQPQPETNTALNAPNDDPFGQQQRPLANDYQVDQQSIITQAELEPAGQVDFQQPIYSTVNKHPDDCQSALYAGQQDFHSAADYGAIGATYANQEETFNERSGDYKENLSHNLISYDELDAADKAAPDGLIEECMQINQEIGQIIARQKAAGAVERGSFRHNFRKKLGLSVSTNENDLTTHRQKFFEQVQDEQEKQTGGPDESAGGQHSLLPQKFKRTHSVSFNVGASRGNRHSVDIRNLPSYLTHKRASIVDVAKGAMSSLISSFGGGAGSGAASVSSHRRDSLNFEEDVEDNEPIFEEPIAPTLSLGQRVAMVRNSGTEFGTVGWIGQLPDIDDDWIVGVIFDNMIGDCDGAYKGVRYFYARDSYAMFVPLSVLTKTDNYIGRPETGTVLSRMSVSLKPGQLISIQRSSIRLQHCFLNAPHQRVGHDVRAVSNRLHCQCHNCGPCAHLTKQGRPSVLPHFGAHHLPIKKKNSLAHAAVEMLAHHHHHFHEEEEHEEKDYEFGDNAAHACNFVRYSCCQQSGQPGHEFSSDCGMVRPELLDNLIHAPRAPHRRSRPRRRQQRSRASRAKQRAGKQLGEELAAPTRAAIEFAPEAADAFATLDTNQSTVTGGTQTMTDTMRSSACDTTELTGADEAGSEGSQSSYLSSRAGSGSSSQSSSSRGTSRSGSPTNGPSEPYNYYQYDTSSFRPQNSVYKTVESQVSIVDQQRFVFARNSSGFVQSPMPSNWSDSQASSLTAGGLGTRILRCLGCLKGRSSRRRPRRKLSFKDKVLEYRRRQSTFVPSTLAKPHEDFASHGLVYPGSGPPQLSGPMDANSDYSSCSRSSSGSSSGSNSPHHDGQLLAAEITTQNVLYQQQSVTLEHGHPAYPNEQLKSSAGWASHLIADAEQEYKRQLNYGDYNFTDGYDTYKYHEHSKDSALTDLAYSDTYKTDCSSDTLKHLVDQSINEQVEPLGPMAEHQMAISPLSSSNGQPGYECNGSTISEQVDVSSPTASAIDEGLDEEREAAQGEELRLDFENLQLSSPGDSQHHS